MARALHEGDVLAVGEPGGDRDAEHIGAAVVLADVDHRRDVDDCAPDRVRDRLTDSGGVVARYAARRW